jgi:hypothetical protein
MDLLWRFEREQVKKKFKKILNKKAQQVALNSTTFGCYL